MLAETSSCGSAVIYIFFNHLIVVVLEWVYSWNSYGSGDYVLAFQLQSLILGDLMTFVSTNVF